ncbi:hypothetical protein EDB89DRAFT_1924568 [Lactarius sanguifluus]|nr:hypothetical protein EDB89DRAFT_1924568 [Lactarius sanguifluus]
MDILPENDGLASETPTLSYDEDIAYEDQVQPSLVDRIGRAKVYLLSETKITQGRKRKREEEGEEEEEEQVKTKEETEMSTDDGTRRPNALLLQGKPIVHMPTKLIFEYVTHYEAMPLGLEWVDDTTCVILFASSEAATTALSLLQRTASETPDESGFVQAKSIPMAFWPPKERIDASLGKGEGLKGALFLRWAEVTDVKQRGARSRSEFYRKHGVDGDARREDGQETKRRKQEELDDELDAFLREESPEDTSSPPSKMRSDYIEERKGRGKSLLERTSQMRAYFTDEEDPGSWKKSLETRLTSPRQIGRPWDKLSGDGARGPKEGGNWTEGGEVRSRHERPRKSQQELDDELDAFLNERE